MKRPILLVFAHPDDESFGLAGTVLKYTRQGVPVDLVCATQGEKGPRLDVPAHMDTGTVRVAELRAAAAIMGIRNIYLLGYIDGELDAADADEIMNKVLEIMRQPRRKRRRMRSLSRTFVATFSRLSTSSGSRYVFIFSSLVLSQPHH